MRTTIRLDDELLSEAKAVAARTHRNLNDVIADAVRESLARVRQRQASPVSLTTFRGSGLQPGVDLDDSSALQDLMDESE